MSVCWPGVVEGGRTEVEEEGRCQRRERGAGRSVVKTCFYHTVVVSSHDFFPSES